MVLILEVESNEQGRLTIPAQAREALRVEGKAHWQVEVREDGLFFRPAVVIPRDDAWAYTPEHLARIAEAHQQIAARNVQRLSPEELERLTDPGRDG